MTVLPWYALQVRPRFEKQIASALVSKGIEGFLPLYRHRSRWSDRVKEVHLPLFSGYLFCRLDLNHRLPVLVTPGVMHIVGIGKTPHPVEEEEIAVLQSIVWLFSKICGYKSVSVKPMEKWKSLAKKRLDFPTFPQVLLIYLF